MKREDDTSVKYFTKPESEDFLKDFKNYLNIDVKV